MTNAKLPARARPLEALLPALIVLSAGLACRHPDVTPTFGGNLLPIGEQQLELAILEDGQVHGWLYDVRGQAVSGSEPVQLSVALRTRGGGQPRASLAWDAAHARFQGRAPLEAGLVGEPIAISLERQGKRAAATLDVYAIQPRARFGGAVIAVGPYAVELVAEPEALLAHVLDASGQAQARADLLLRLEPAEGAALAFEWEPARSLYRTSTTERPHVALGPLRLSVTASGKMYTSAVRSLRETAASRNN